MPMALDHVFPQDFRNDMNDIMGLLDTLPVYVVRPFGTNHPVF